MRLGSREAQKWFSQGDFDGATKGLRALAATYYVAEGQHLGLDPISATARVTGRSVEVWAATQSPAFARSAIARSAGVSDEEIAFYPLPTGEPAGRAMEAQAAPLAVELARQAGHPVQLVLSQSAGQNHDLCSSGAMARMTALLDQAGAPHGVANARRNKRRFQRGALPDGRRESTKATRKNCARYGRSTLLNSQPAGAGDQCRCPVANRLHARIASARNGFLHRKLHR